MSDKWKPSEATLRMARIIGARFVYRPKWAPAPKDASHD